MLCCAGGVPGPTAKEDVFPHFGGGVWAERTHVPFITHTHGTACALSCRRGARPHGQRGCASPPRGLGMGRARLAVGQRLGGGWRGVQGAHYSTSGASRGKNGVGAMRGGSRRGGTAEKALGEGETDPAHPSFPGMSSFCLFHGRLNACSVPLCPCSYVTTIPSPLRLQSGA